MERATCGTLLRYSDTTGQLAPELAARPPTISPDRLTYTFPIRSGLRFAPPSGAKVTAAAVAYSIRRALSAKLGTPRPAGAYLGDLKNIDVRGNRIAFTLRAPSPDFLERLSLPYFCTVPFGTPIVVGGVQPTAPPSAGPYYMDSRGNGAWTVLKRNPYYRGPRPARLDAIVLREGLDPERAVELVRRGDWYGLALAEPFVRPRLTSTAGFAYRAAPEARLDYVALNSGRGPFRDQGLRQRVSTALDRAALATAASVQPTAGVLPPGLRGGSIEPAKRPGRAMAHMQPIHLTLAVDRDQEDVATVISGALRRLGIEVTPVVVDDAATAISRPGSQVDMAALETELPYPDPGSFLARLLGHDVPASWLTATTRTAVARLGSLSGRSRDRAAIALARYLEHTDVPVVAYGTPTIGILLGPKLGCRTRDAFDSELDLTTLCVSSG
jgi:ABC-type transport system substrate-binding protein